MTRSAGPRWTRSRPPRTSGPRPRSRTVCWPTRSSRSRFPQRKGDPILVEHDEGVRPGTTAESLGKLRPAFDPDGTITAGNASQLSDGGSAVVVMSKAAAAGGRRRAARRGRQLRHGGRPRQRLAATAAGERDREGALEDRPDGRRHRRCSSSTRRSPRSASPRPASSGSASTSSTSTAVRSRSVTRSA